MIERQKRLNEVYEHLRKYYGIHTQTDFAVSLKYSRSVISAALNGKEDYLTDKLFTNICEAYPETFNIEYLLHGTGQLLTIREEVANDEMENLVNPKNQIDQGSLVNAALAAKDDAIEALKQRIRDKDEIIQGLREQLEDKNQIIAEQKARLIDYRRIIDSKNDIESYPFPVGAADQVKSRKRIK